MGYDLTEDRQELTRWLVGAVRDGRMREEFVVTWLGDAGALIVFIDLLLRMTDDLMEGEGA